MTNLDDLIEEMIHAIEGLLNSHDEVNGSCLECMEDGRGTHSEQIQELIRRYQAIISID